MPKLNQWEFTMGNSPLVATAIHHGHNLREEVSARQIIGENERLREEDPFTGLWTDIAETRIVLSTSRFEMDLNRPREKAVYINREDAWGLDIWEKRPPRDLIARSLEQYDLFYERAFELFSDLETRYGQFVVLDLHTYNHRRQGPEASASDINENPEINVGTGSLNRAKWGLIADRFIRELSDFDFSGRGLDVRENVKFKGGYFSRWIHENFPGSGCCLAVEVKKFFMDEWTGKLDRGIFDNIHRAFESTVPGLLEQLGKTRHDGHS